MENTEVVTRAEQAYRRLRSEILHGDLMPGERLRASDLQDKFQLGLTPIREALMRLSGENLVELDTHRGSRVTETSLEELRDLMNTRRGVESLCLRSAIAHGDTAWEAAIVAALHTLSRTPLPATPEDRHAAAAWETAHRAFHHALVSACAEKWLLWFWNILADHSERYRKQRLLHLRSRPPARAAEDRDVHEEHRGLVAAILERDADEACRRMDEHLQATEQAVAALLSQAPASHRPSHPDPEAPR